jgi:DNA mismatch endonuclease (patch repair protein)
MKLSIRSRAPSSSSRLVRRVMQANRGRDTIPERLFRAHLHNRGLRFRIDVRPEPTCRCKADLVFRRFRVCLFVDGCFWHGCPTHFSCPKRNAVWWQEKISDNVARDRRKSKILAEAGWTVIRIWEHEIAQNPDGCVRRVLAALNRRGRRRHAASLPRGVKRGLIAEDENA